MIDLSHLNGPRYRVIPFWSQEEDLGNPVQIPSETPTHAIVPAESAAISMREQRKEVQIAVQNVMSFMTSPVDSEYFDEILGKKFINPDHSNLVPLAMKYFVRGDYKGIGVSRRKHIELHTGVTVCCDLLYFTKKKDQIDFENSRLSFLASISNSLFSDIQKRIQRQKESCQKIQADLPDQIKKWGYSRVCYFASMDQLKKAGFSEETAQSIHAIAFIYGVKKKCTRN